jgi:hypothetical protein
MMTSLNIFHFADGKIAEQWVETDNFGSVATSRCDSNARASSAQYWVITVDVPPATRKRRSRWHCAERYAQFPGGRGLLTAQVLQGSQKVDGHLRTPAVLSAQPYDQVVCWFLPGRYSSCVTRYFARADLE